MPTLATVGNTVEVLRCLKSGQKYWHRGFITHVYALANGTPTFEYDVQLELTAERHRKSVQAETIRKIHGQYIRSLYTPGLNIWFEVSAFDWREGFIESIKTNIVDSGAIYTINYTSGNKSKIVDCVAKRLKPKPINGDAISSGVDASFLNQGKWTTGSLLNIDSDGAYHVCVHKYDSVQHFVKRTDEIHQWWNDGKEIEIYRFDVSAWLPGRIVKHNGNDGTYIVELYSPSEMDVRRNKKRMRWARRVSPDTIRNCKDINTQKHACNDINTNFQKKTLQTFTLPRSLADETSSYDDPLDNSFALHDNCMVYVSVDNNERSVPGRIINCRYDGTYDIRTLHEKPNTLHSVARHRLCLRFEKGDHVKYSVEVVKMEELSDTVVG